jgi:hypothetical protein
MLFYLFWFGTGAHIFCGGLRSDGWPCHPYAIKDSFTQTCPYNFGIVRLVVISNSSSCIFTMLHFFFFCSYCLCSSFVNSCCAYTFKKHSHTNTIIHIMHIDKRQQGLHCNFLFSVNQI